MCCSKRQTFFILLLVQIVSSASETVAEDNCMTPDNEQGICIDLRRCDDLMAILLKKPLTEEDRNYLRSRQCGLSNGMPWVCCRQQHSQSNRRNLTEGCGVFTTYRIFRGLYTLIDEYPWTALIAHKDKDNNNTSKYLCTGALISENYVLAAAHCMNKGYVPVSVRLGEHNLATEIDCEAGDCADPPQDIPIADIVVHKEFIYNSSSLIPNNDIALIRLSQPAKFDVFVRPICLPIAERLNIDFSQMRRPFQVTGWSHDLSPFDSRKSQFNAAYVTLDQCKRLYEKDNVTVAPEQLCIGQSSKYQEGKALCQGDTFILSDIVNDDHRYDFIHYLAGLFSVEPDSCMTDGRPVVYTNVTAYVDWIFDNMRS